MHLAPFCTWFTPSPEMSASDIQKEITRLYRRQKALDALAYGELDEDQWWDLLAEDGIEPDAWIQTSAENAVFLLGREV
jgi:hypothetical protein